AGRLRQARRAVRCARGVVRLGDPAVQHDHLDGPTHSERAALVCAVRARGHRRAHSRQGGGFQAQGPVGRRNGAAGIRTQGWQALHRRRGGRAGPRLRPLSPIALPEGGTARNLVSLLLGVIGKSCSKPPYVTVCLLFAGNNFVRWVKYRSAPPETLWRPSILRYSE